MGGNPPPYRKRWPCKPRPMYRGSVSIFLVSREPRAKNANHSSWVPLPLSFPLEAGIAGLMWPSFCKMEVPYNIHAETCWTKLLALVGGLTCGLTDEQRAEPVSYNEL